MSLMAENEGSGESGGLLPVARRGEPVEAHRGLLTGPIAAPAPLVGVPAGRTVTLSMMLRHKWLALGLFVGLAVVLGGGVWWTTVPLYKATAVIEVSPIIQRILYRTDDNGPIQWYTEYLNMQTAIIRSNTVLQPVLEDPEIQATGWFNERPRSLFGGEQSPLERLREALTVTVRPRTSLIDITMQARDKTSAAKIVNAVARRYEAHSDEQQRMKSDLRWQELDQRKRDLETEIAHHKEMVLKYRTDLGVTTADELVTQQRTRTDAEQAQLASLRQEIKLIEFQLEMARPVQEKGAPGDHAPVQPEYALDPGWQELNVAVYEAEHRLETEGARLGDANQRMAELRAEVEHRKRLRAMRERDLHNLWKTNPGRALADATTAGAALGGEVRQLEHRLKLLKYQESLKVADLEKEQELHRGTLTSSQALEREMAEVSRKQGLYESAVQRLSELDIEGRAPGRINVQSYADEPSEPYNARRSLLLTAMAICGAAALALAAAYVRVSLDQAVQGVSDLKGPFETPFLGCVPLLRDPQRPSEQEQAAQTEHVRMIRTALLERIDRQRGSAVLISSAGPQAGKSTLALLLAESLAQCGKHVLLVDTDLRNSAVSKRCGVRAEPGLVGVLTSKATDAEAVSHYNGTDLDVLPAGRLGASHDPELLANGMIAASLKRWKSQYDVVLLDASPVLPVADARILARLVDGALLVVREGRCRRGDVADALALLWASGTKPLGTVIFASRNRIGYPSYTVLPSPRPANSADSALETPSLPASQ